MRLSWAMLCTRVELLLRQCRKYTQGLLRREELVHRELVVRSCVQGVEKLEMLSVVAPR